MKKITSTIAVMLIFTLVLTSTMVTADGGGQHWVYEELPDFKQQIYPLFTEAIDKGIITKEEWESVHSIVLNDMYMDDPIDINHWAVMLKFIIKLPEIQMDEHMKMYVYDFDQAGHMVRENAVGGLIKLLTIEHISGSWSISDKGPNASEDLLDFDSISEKQQELVRIAYRDQILDGTVSNQFRPMDSLTNAEAISMLYRVIMKYIINDQDQQKEQQHTKESLTAWPEDHWSAKEMNLFFATAQNTDELLNIIQLVGKNDRDHLETEITVQSWNDLVVEALKTSQNTDHINLVNDYTFALSSDDYITRDKAIVTLMKLWTVGRRDATVLERENAANAFKDFDQAFDMSKLAIAYSEGLVNGYGNQMFYPKKRLNNGEAAILISRILKTEK